MIKTHDPRPGVLKYRANSVSDKNDMIAARKARVEQEFPEGRCAVKIKEAADLLGLSPTTIRRLIKRGDLKAVKALRHPLISLYEISRFLDPISE